MSIFEEDKKKLVIISYFQFTSLNVNTCLTELDAFIFILKHIIIKTFLPSVETVARGHKSLTLLRQLWVRFPLGEMNIRKAKKFKSLLIF